MAIAVNQKCAGIDSYTIIRARAEASHAANPLTVFPNCFHGSPITAVENVAASGPQSPLLRIIPGVAGADGDELEHARIAVAVDHAAGAAVANQLRFIPFIYVAHGGLPKVAAVKVQVPIEVEILVAAEAAEFLRFLAQVPLHFGQRLGRVHDGIAALFFHLLDLLEYLDEFVGLVTDEA